MHRQWLRVKIRLTHFITYCYYIPSGLPTVVLYISCYPQQNGDREEEKKKNPQVLPITLERIIHEKGLLTLCMAAL